PWRARPFFQFLRGASAKVVANLLVPPEIPRRQRRQANASLIHTKFRQPKFPETKVHRGSRDQPTLVFSQARPPSVLPALRCQKYRMNTQWLCYKCRIICRETNIMQQAVNT